MRKTLSALFLFLFIFGLFNITGIKAEGVTITSKVGKVSVTSGKLNVRSDKSTSSNIIAALNNGEYITLIEKSGSWWKVEYADNKFGYCHESFIKSVYGITKKVNITYGSLNVRKGGGTSYSVKDTLGRNEAVIELWTQGEWSYILYDGNEKGFVKSSYLSPVSAVNEIYPEIKLNVPDFKQTDSRWANVKLGSSGKTIRDIGCTTTGIAMMESYRASYNIYPGEMAAKLKYTSSGNLYWPSDYTAVTSSSGYLNKIYNILKEAKPVLIGCKNSYGSQHWVVITGYKGGNSLSASNFIINDPGTSKRTTLQDFLNSYPNFYKFFYY